MTRRIVRARLSLSVGQRLFLGLLPSLLAVALVAGLSYYGQYARTAPEFIVVTAAVLALASLTITWRNTRYLARRIARLAGTGGTGASISPRAASGISAGNDELDRIEQVVDSLGSALTAAETERERAAALALSRLHQHATMLSATVRMALSRLDEVRLPLHILLEVKFGDLNENQEELLTDARAAADAIDSALRRLGEVADADRGALPVTRELVQVNDVVRAVLPMAQATVARRSSRVDVMLEPGLPRVQADRVRLAQAVALLIDAASESVDPDRPMAISTARDNRQAVITVSPAARSVGASEATESTNAHDVVLAARLVEVQGGVLDVAGNAMTIRIG